MKCKKIKKLTSLTLALSTIGATVALPVSAAELKPSQPGLWLTEIYQNDIDRSSVYGNKSDHMEFVEVTNTGDTDVAFNNGYEIWYEYPSDGSYTMKQLTVTALNDETEVIIPANKSVVLWNQRTDIGGTEGTDYASEEQFRTAMNIPSDVLVYKVSGQEGFAENDRGFAIKDKSGNILSYYHYNTTKDEVTQDGLSVHLKVPETGSTMQVWQAKKLTSAGFAYSDQLAGQRNVTIPSTQPSGLYITEIRPNDSDRSSVYGSGTNDLMECLELTNTTDKEIDLNKEYELVYRVKEGSYKTLPLYHLNQDGTCGTSDDCVVPAKSTVVLWCYRAGYGLTQGKDYDTYPTEQEFREAYDIPEDVPVYIFTGQNGLANTFRGFDLYKLEEQGKTLVSRYFWDGSSDLKDNRSVDLKISSEGPLMSVYGSQRVTNMGKVDDAQITFSADDGSSPTVTLSTDPYDADALTVLENGLDYGENLRIPYSYSGTETLPVKKAELFWRTSEMDHYETTTTTSFSIYNKWYAFIDNGYLQGADWVEYYVKFYNSYRCTKTDLQRVEIHNDSEQPDGTRISINGTDIADKDYSGTVQVSAKNFGGTLSSIQLDGENLTTEAAMERGAYFVFDHTGVDSYFKNGLTTGGDTEETGTIIGTFSKCSTIPSSGRLAMLVNGQYFTYNDDGSASIELTVRPATYGSCWEAYNDENNEDFVASNMKLILRDGTAISPSTCVGENITTREVVDLNADGPIKIGDSANQYIYVKMTFDIPADKVDLTALTAEVDTTKLSDGEHTLTAGDTTVTFSVNNSDPQPVTPTEPELNVSVSLDDSKNTIQVTEVTGASSVSIYNANTIDDITVMEGTGDNTYNAVKKDNETATSSDDGEYPYQILQIPVNENEENLRIQLDATSNYDSPVRLYVRNGNSWEVLDVERDNDTLTAICPVAEHIIDGNVEVLIQARTTATAPYINEKTFKTNVGDNSDWDGKTVTEDNPYATPESYDFSIAWYTDTQYYSEQYNKHYSDMVSWIIENQKNLNIKYVLHTGDIADEFNEEYQFAYARSQQDRLQQAGIPTGVLGGNHDVAHGNMVYDLYWKYFGAEYYLNDPWYGGSYRNNLGHYDIIEAGGEKLLFIDISWDIYTPEIEWINSVLDAYPDTKAIITTHGGINASATESYTSRILQKVCKNNPQVIAILNGHYHGSSINFVELTSDSGETHTVYQICTDYQSATEGGSGYIKMLYFDLANDKIYINSYSPSAPDKDGQSDVNYYDDKELLDYSDSMLTADENGIKRYTDYDIDVIALPVSFDRNSNKELRVSNIKVYGLGGEELATGEIDKPISLTIDSGLVYAAVKDDSGNSIAYTKVSNLTPINNTSTISSTAITEGESVTITASATEGTDPYQYAITARHSSATKWTTLKHYSTTTTRTWTPSMTGTYQVCAKVKDSNGREVKKFFTLTVNADPSKPINNSTISSTTITEGESVTITASATNGTEPYQYAMSVRHSTATKWTTIKGYDTTATKVWTPAMTGTYQVCAKFKDANGTEVKKFFKLTVKADQSKPINNSTISSTIIAKGNSVTINASATGSTEPYQYAVSVKHSTATGWTTIKGYDTTSTKVWTPAKTGSYQICVKVKDANGTEAKKYFALTVK